jgi:hypothetical protein
MALECCASTGGHVALDRLDRLRRVGGGEVEEDATQAVEGVAARLEGVDRVGEGRRVRIGGDGLDLGAMLGQRPLEGGAIVVDGDLGEGGDPERRGPGAEEGVVGVLAHGRNVEGRRGVGKGDMQAPCKTQVLPSRLASLAPQDEGG